MSASAEISHVVDHLFRHEAGRMVATLARIFGLQNLSLAEDVVQEALLRALQTWSFGNVPQNPSAWILQVAKRLALDVIRRERTFLSKENEIAHSIESTAGTVSDYDSLFMEGEIRDDQLRMMFACCHPALPREAQVALTLKTLCGFSEREIAAAFLVSPAAIAKRLVRARQKIRDDRMPFAIPASADLSPRLDAMLQVLYLLHNEGYKASEGDQLVRDDLCDEALRLANLLIEHRAGNQPRTHALVALMWLNIARLAARVDADGNLLLLAEQDRSLWDLRMIQRGLFHLNESAAGERITEFHLQAGIAFCHCTARTYADTDWRRILELYDLLVAINPSPVLALNRAVAVFKAQGAAEGLDAVNNIAEIGTLDSYYLLHAVRGEMHSALGRQAEAAVCFRKALQFTSVKSERAFLEKKLRGCESN